VSRPRFRREVRRRFWCGVRAGLGVVQAAEAAGVSERWARAEFREYGGVNPFPVAEPKGRYMSFSEREEIMRLDAAGASASQIARELGRALSTITRDLVQGRDGRGRYRASVAQQQADASRAKPRERKLATNLPLRAAVQKQLKSRLSPQQIAGRLKREHPDDPEMRVSPETIYQALYLQGRGGLKKELTKYLRSGRTVRKPRRKSGERRGRIVDAVGISQRPPEVEDRAVPGDWEGDLIMGSKASNSAVATLVERTTGFLILVHLPNGHTAQAVQEALVRKIGDLPEILRRSLTWDRGQEMANHLKIAEEADIDIYFADPHSPWQRGTNENTNGLVRQYLPKGEDLSFYGEGMLDNIAAEINARPRKRHDWLTPAEKLNEYLAANIAS
jgi:IS30 family transposase